MATATLSAGLLSSADAAVYIGVREQTLAVWRSTGRYSLPFIKSGRLVRYRRSDLENFLTSRTVTSTGQLDRAGI